MLSTDRVVVVIDGPDPDNLVAVLAATSEALRMHVAAVIVTGHPVSNEWSQPSNNNPYASEAVVRDNALHVKGVLMRHGREYVPVFTGGRAPYTSVLHDMHVHERVTDIYDDAHAGHWLAGGIDHAVAYLARLGGRLHIVGAGPMTDIAYLQRQPMLHGRLGLLVAHLGMFGSPRVSTPAGGTRQSNVLADPCAAHEVLTEYPNMVIMVPTDVTKLPEHAFGDPNELAGFAESPAFEEVVAMYRAWHDWSGNKSRLTYVHGFHPALLMAAALRHNIIEPGEYGPYTISQTGIRYVPHLPAEIDHWGEVHPGDPVPGVAPRFVVTGADTMAHVELLSRCLNVSAYVPDEPLPQLP